MATLGERVRELRERQKLTQNELVERAKLSKGFLSDIENNKRKVGSEYLLKIANALGVSVDYLLTGEEDPEMAAAAPLVIPRELHEYAVQAHLTYKETMDLLSAHRSILARRSNELSTVLSVEEWKRFYDTLKHLYG